MGDTSDGAYEQKETPNLWSGVHELRRRYGDMGDEHNRSLGGLTAGVAGWLLLAAAVFIYGAVSGRIPQDEAAWLTLIIVGVAVAQYLYMRRQLHAFFEHYVKSRLHVVFEEARQELRRPMPRANDYRASDWVRMHALLATLEADEIAMVDRLNALKGGYICWWMSTVGHKWNTDEAYSFMYSYAGVGGELGRWYYQRKRTLEELAAFEPMAQVA